LSLIQSDALQAQRQPTCFVCGLENPRGLQVHYECGVDGTVNATWTPTSMCEGYRGIVHGGIVSTVLDEAMSKAVFATKCQTLTCELRVRFRHHVAVGEPLRICGWVVARHKRKITAEARLSTLDGKECAQAWATFLVLAGTQSDQPALESGLAGSA
jgi:acyl-coenzyme A thioesterase PaaI-like protein